MQVRGLRRFHQNSKEKFESIHKVPIKIVEKIDNWITKSVSNYNFTSVFVYFRFTFSFHVDFRFPSLVLMVEYSVYFF